MVKENNVHVTASNDEDSREDLCLVCACKVVLRVIGPCDHPLCHMCAVKLRTLYNNMECTFCKINMPLVVMTQNKTGTYKMLVNSSMKLDKKTGIYLDGKFARESFDMLLNFHCPESICCYIACDGWAEIKKHVMKVHKKSFCDVCLSSQKKFCVEFKIYTQNALAIHQTRGDKDDPTFKGHPLCKYCKIRYYDTESLKKHMKRSHEECFICVRNWLNENEYHKDYNALEEHFRKMHFMCDRQKCIEQKFVVYSSRKELQEHFKEAHTDFPSKHPKIKEIIPRIKSNVHSRLENSLTFDRMGTSSSINRTNPIRDIRLLPSSFLSRPSGNGASSRLKNEEDPNNLDFWSSPRSSYAQTYESLRNKNRDTLLSDNLSNNLQPSIASASNQIKPGKNALSKNTPIASYTQNTPNDGIPLPNKELSQSSIDEAFDTLTIYQKELLSSLFDDDPRMIQDFVKHFAKFHFRTIGANTFAQCIGSILLSKYQGKELVDKIDDATFFVKNFASLASSIYRYAGLDIGMLLVEGWEAHSSEILGTISIDENNNSSQGFTPVQKTSEEMFPSLPQSTNSPVIIKTFSKTSKSNTFSSALKSTIVSSSYQNKKSPFSSALTKDVFPALNPPTTTTPASYQPPNSKKLPSIPTSSKHPPPKNKSDFPSLPQNKPTPTPSSSISNPQSAWNHTREAFKQSDALCHTTKNKKGGKKIILF